MTDSSFPAISVIIPFNNAEKYIGECLDSLLNQTFQNFEVIVVDDCSTDNSFAVVESYIPKFDGRLQLANTRENSRSPGEPQNVGFALSRGEYFFILESDDAITSTAFEELYPVAKKFDADVVVCESCYGIPEDMWHNIEFRRQLKPSSYQRGEFVTEPTLITESIEERVKNCYNRRFLWPLWSKLIRRDFFIKNHLRFANNVIQDFLTTLCVIYVAEKYVRVPNVINYYRVRNDSISHERMIMAKHVRKYVKSLIAGFDYMEDFFRGRKFFQEHPDIKYLALETVFLEVFNYLKEVYEKIPAPELDELLREEFADCQNTALMVYVFSTVNVQRVQLFQAQQQINEIVEKANQQAQQFKKLATQARDYITQLEAEVNRLKNKE